MREVAGVAARDQRQAAVGQNDVWAFVENPPNHAPFAGHQLVGAVDVRVAKEGGVGMASHHHLLRHRDHVRKPRLLFGRHERISLGRWNLQPWRKIRIRLEVTAIAGDAADADEARSFPYERLGHEAQASIGRKHQIEGAPGQRRVERFPEMRVGVDMLDFGRDLRNFMRSAMQHRNAIAPLYQSVDQKWPGRAGSADYQCFHHYSVPILLLLMLWLMPIFAEPRASTSRAEQLRAHVLVDVIFVYSR